MVSPQELVTQGFGHVTRFDSQFFRISFIRHLSCLRWALSLALFCASVSSQAYSLLTHEQIIDIMWKDEITPLLLKRFPGATEQELQKAHAFAYGGCLVQDMGYYPLVNKFFSDLTSFPISRNPQK